MGSVKRWLKKIFYATGTAPLLDRGIFLWSQLTYGPANRRYKKDHPGIALPPAYFLYETYMPDYEKYMKDGEDAAREILSWTTPYLEGGPLQIMEWGCGVARIIRHIPAYVPAGSEVYGCDINQIMIDWNRKNIPGISFACIASHPPTTYINGQFHLVYGISVFTHIDGREQLLWLEEMSRILCDGGVFLFTTHGKHYLHQLSDDESARFRSDGFFTRAYPDKGHRMMTTYNDATSFSKQVESWFDIVEFHDGHQEQGLTGGQDLWILKKK